MKEAGEDHPQIYAIHLDSLLKQKLAFHVKYSTFYKQCSIVMLNRDEHVYNMIHEYMNPNEILSTELTLYKTSSTNTPPPSKRDDATIRYDDAPPTMYLTPQNSST